jgi:hypothetical protein
MVTGNPFEPGDRVRHPEWDAVGTVVEAIAYTVVVRWDAEGIEAGVLCEDLEAVGP